MGSVEASPLLDELDMRPCVRALGSCAVLSCVLLGSAQEASAQSAQESAPRRTSTTTLVGASALTVGYLPAFVMATGSLGHAIANFKPLCGGGGMISWGRCPEHDAISLYVPVIGPLYYSQSNTGDDLYRRERGPSTTEQALLYSSAALQFGGLVTLLVGVASNGHRTERAASSTVVAPMTSNGSSGVMVGSTF